jgi:hypothetical protein
VHDSKIPEHTLAAVEKALYGLPTSAKRRWNPHLSDNLRSMVFEPMRFDPDVWLKLCVCVDKAGYGYISTYTDDLIIIAKDAGHHMSTFRDKYIVSCNYQQSIQ